MKRRLRFLLIAAVVLAVGLSFPVFRHLRLKREVRVLRAELQGQGARFELRQIEDLVLTNNEAGTLLLNNSEAFLIDPIPFVEPMTLLSPGRARAIWSCETLPYDLTVDVWPQWAGLIEVYAPVFETLEQAVHSPLTFEPDVGERREITRDLNILPWHINATRTTAQWFGAASLLALHRDDPAEALRNLRNCLFLLRHWTNDPTVIAGMTRSGITTFAMHTTWEMLQYRGWNDVSLAELQSAWESLNFSASIESTLEVEQIAHLTQFQSRRKQFRDGDRESGWREFLRHAKYAITTPQSGLKEFDRRYPAYWTWKWFDSYEEEMTALRQWNEILQRVHVAHRGSPRSWIALSDAVDTGRGMQNRDRQPYVLSNRYRAGRFIRRMATADAARSLSLTAIALHRHRLQHGEFPPDLASLVPGIISELPVDVNGAALRYRKTGGGFLLYSVGMDGVDDGGVADAADRDFRVLAGELQSIYSGADWVWPARATEEEVREYHERTLNRITPPERSSRDRPAAAVQSEFSTLIQVLISELELTRVRDETNSAE